jgi:cellulose synthase (UDP-forming)
MIITFLIFAFSIRGTSYGVRGFLAHQANEYLAFFGITMAFISFLLGRKIPFKVTPKGKGMRSFKAIIPHIIIFILLIASVVNGSYWLLTSSLPTERGAIAVNLFWALWHITFLSLTIYFSLSGLKEENEGKYFEEALQ